MAQSRKTESASKEEHDRTMSWLYSLCRETEIICRAKGLQKHALILWRAGNILHRETLAAPLIVQGTYDEAWAKGAALCSAEASRLKADFLQVEAKQMRQAAMVFKNFRSTLTTADKIGVVTVPVDISYQDWEALKEGRFTEAWGNNAPAGYVALAKNKFETRA